MEMRTFTLITAVEDCYLRPKSCIITAILWSICCRLKLSHCRQVLELSLQHFVEVAVVVLQTPHLLSCRSATSEVACRLWSSALRVVAMEAKRLEAFGLCTLTLFCCLFYWLLFVLLLSVVLQSCLICCLKTGLLSCC